jgi:YhcH/YjgK/YiaL family protein
MKKISAFILLFVVLSAAIPTGAQTPAKGWTNHTAKKWLRSKEWSGGLLIQPHKSIDKKVFAEQYHLNKTYWDMAFAFLKEHDLQKLAPGKYPIDGDNVYAMVTENPTKDYDSTNWESHRKYLDLQYVISGEEKMGISPLSKLATTKTYDDAKDLQNYSGEGKLYVASPAAFFLFFPSNAHRPNITTGDKKPDKKIVIKIRYAENKA